MKLTILPLLMVTGVIIVISKPSKIMAVVGKRPVGCPTSDTGQLVTAEMCISSSGQFILQLSYLSMCAYEPEFLDRAPTGSVGYIRDQLDANVNLYMYSLVSSFHTACESIKRTSSPVYFGWPQNHTANIDVI